MAMIPHGNASSLMGVRANPAHVPPARAQGAKPLLASRQLHGELLTDLLLAAIASALPERCIPRALPERPVGRTVVIGAGKAAAAMAHAVEANWEGPLRGLVITRYGHKVPCEKVAVREAAHPIPDEAGLKATQEMLGQLEGLGRDDLVLCLISGGGSSLLSAPPPGVNLGELRDVYGALLRSGATIAQMNCVRKHLSLVAGGRLAERVAPARLVTLVISDVPGDDPAIIASGPTVPDPSTRDEALTVLREFGIEPAPAIRNWLESTDSETLKPGSGEFGEIHIVASPQLAVEAAAEVARSAGFSPVILGSAIEGESREVAKVHAGIALQVKKYGQPTRPPCILISGGETSVTVRGDGRGGRNCEFLLALAQALEGERGIYALAADTDGIDGTEENAGAYLSPNTIGLAERAGFPCARGLAESDSYGFFEAAGTLVVTGPTLTNVNDFRAILVDRAN